MAGMNYGNADNYQIKRKPFIPVIKFLHKNIIINNCSNVQNKNKLKVKVFELQNANYSNTKDSLNEITYSENHFVLRHLRPRLSRRKSG